MTRRASHFGWVNAIHCDRPLPRDELAHYVPSVLRSINHAAVASIAVNNGVALWTGHVQ